MIEIHQNEKDKSYNPNVFVDIKFLICKATLYHVTYPCNKCFISAKTHLRNFLKILNVRNIWNILYEFYKSISVNCPP